MSQIENAFIPIFDKIFEISDLSLNQEETDATINWLQLKVIIQQSIRLNSPPQFKEPTRQERAAADSIHRFALERRQQFYRDRKVPHSTQFFLCRTVQKNFLPGSATYNDAIGYRGNDPILVESLSALLPGFGFWMQSNIPEENLTLKKINMCADESGKHQCFCKLDRFKSTNILPKNHKVWDYDLAKIAVEAMKELGPNMLEHL